MWEEEEGERGIEISYGFSLKVNKSPIASFPVLVNSAVIGGRPINCGLPCTISCPNGMIYDEWGCETCTCSKY